MTEAGMRQTSTVYDDANNQVYTYEDQKTSESFGGSSQTTGSNSYSFSYGYNLTDSLTSEAYPSGRVVKTCYDTANRVSQVGGTTCGSATGAYISNMQYAAHNQPTQYVMGNNVWHAPSYNSRLQMSGFIDSVNGSPSNELMNASLVWCLIQQNGASNNGSQFNTACSSPVKDNGHNCGPATFTEADPQGNITSSSVIWDFSTCSFESFVIGAANVLVQSVMPSLQAGQAAFDWASQP